MNRHQLLIVITLACAVPVTTQAQSERWWGDIKALADDSMRGRNTGSVEHKKAADYIAASFKASGLKPAGINGYIQPVAFVVRTLDESRSSLALVRAGKVQPLTLGEDATFTTRAQLAERGRRHRICRLRTRPAAVRT